MAFLTHHLLFITALLLAFAAPSIHAFTCPPSQTAIVNAMYAQGLNRSPDDSGFRAYCENLVGGKSTKDLFKAIVRSPEYRQKFVDEKSEFFVVANLYKTVLSRCPDKGGLLNYVANLDSKGETGACMRLVETLFNSREYNDKFGVNVVPNPKPAGVRPGRPF